MSGHVRTHGGHRCHCMRKYALETSPGADCENMCSAKIIRPYYPRMVAVLSRLGDVETPPIFSRGTPCGLWRTEESGERELRLREMIKRSIQYACTVRCGQQVYSMRVLYDVCGQQTKHSLHTHKMHDTYSTVHRRHADVMIIQNEIDRAPYCTGSNKYTGSWGKGRLQAVI